jgi:hypothetical protein
MDALVPIVIAIVVPLVIAHFTARARRTPPIEQDGITVFKQSTGSCHLRISEQGVHRDPYWWFGELVIRWEDIIEIEENTGNQAITVKSRQGKKIQHLMHAAPQDFKRMIQRRTKLPLTVATPGIWKVEKTQIPYRD